MNIERLALGQLDTNCYIVSVKLGSPVIVIDPAGEPEVLLATIAERKISCVVLTHCHFDHLGAVSALLAEQDAPLAVHELDADFITDSVGTGGAGWGFDAVAPPATRRLVDGDVIQADTVALRVIATPG
ncbi:MAG: MBL fold metallo-hydrolase, partial [Coriobacteriia bacterium]|nr:MBL fold metallo-hydrolase [Coriobacteriia bacterium]